MLSRASKRPWDGRRPRDGWLKATGQLAEGQKMAGRRPREGWPKARGWPNFTERPQDDTLGVCAIKGSRLGIFLLLTNATNLWGHRL